jgi:hypothetical protein
MRILTLMAAIAMGCAGCAHVQQPESRVYVIAEDARGVGEALGTGGSGGRDCQAEHEECFRRCWEKRRPPYPHKHDGWYYERCTQDCREEFNRCEEEQEQEAKERTKKLEFSRVDEAIDWIKHHKARWRLGLWLSSQVLPSSSRQVVLARWSWFHWRFRAQPGVTWSMIPTSMWMRFSLSWGQ